MSKYIPIKVKYKQLNFYNKHTIDKPNLNLKK